MESRHIPARKLSLVLADTVHTFIANVVHVDHTGIYTIGENSLWMYDFDFKLRTRYKCSQYCHVMFVSTAPRLVCATTTTVYSAHSRHDYQSLVAEYSNQPYGFVALKYHPIRDTYLAISTAGNIIELDSSLRVADSAVRVDPYMANLLASEHSSTMYLSSRGNLDMIAASNSVARIVSFPQIFTMTMRPEHPEVLTIADVASINTVDMWHSGAAGTSHICCIPEISQDANVYEPHHCTQIGANVCVLTKYRWLHVMDYRCGIVHARLMPDNAFNAWYANGRVYVKGWDTTTVFDV